MYSTDRAFSLTTGSVVFICASRSSTVRTAVLSDLGLLVPILLYISLGQDLESMHSRPTPSKPNLATMGSGMLPALWVGRAVQARRYSRFTHRHSGCTCMQQWRPNPISSFIVRPQLGGASGGINWGFTWPSREQVFVMVWDLI